MGCCGSKKEQICKKEEIGLVDTELPAHQYPSRGRPYFGDEAILLLPAVNREEETGNSSFKIWNEYEEHSNYKPKIERLSKEERERLTKKWIESGKAEHASVASFSLFAQKLVAIGAPPELISEAFDCAKDEIQHAKYCFTLASYYSGTSIEPTVYNNHSVQINNDINDIVLSTIEEGCIEETISALICAFDYIDETDDYVKSVYFQITVDEAKHAAFAWKFLIWALNSSHHHHHREYRTQWIDYLQSLIVNYKLDDLKKRSEMQETVKLLNELIQMIISGQFTPSNQLSQILSISHQINHPQYLISLIFSKLFDVIQTYDHSFVRSEAL